MKLTIKTDSDLIANESLNLFIEEFKKSLKTGVTSGSFKSEFLNFNWKSE